MGISVFDQLTGKRRNELIWVRVCHFGPLRRYGHNLSMSANLLALTDTCPCAGYLDSRTR